MYWAKSAKRYLLQVKKNIKREDCTMYRVQRCQVASFYYVTLIIIIIIPFQLFSFKILIFQSLFSPSSSTQIGESKQQQHGSISTFCLCIGCCPPKKNKTLLIVVITHEREREEEDEKWEKNSRSKIRIPTCVRDVGWCVDTRCCCWCLFDDDDDDHDVVIREEICT